MRTIYTLDWRRRIIIIYYYFGSRPGGSSLDQTEALGLGALFLFATWPASYVTPIRRAQLYAGLPDSIPCLLVTTHNTPEGLFPGVVVL